MAPKPDSLKKAGFLEYLRTLIGKQPKPLRFAVIPYKHEGSTAGEDGIRIMGSREFIENVLVRLGVEGILAYENTQTRLRVMFQEAVNQKQGTINGWVCYIQVQQRGSEAQMANALASAITGKQTIVSTG
jgi:hypothetical protein